MHTSLASAITKILAVSLVIAAPTARAASAAAPAPGADPPAIAGAPRVGQTLTLSPGTWSGVGSPSFTYQWQRCIGAPYAAEVLRDAPVAYYRLGDAAESLDLTDATGGGLGGTFRNGVAQEVDGGLVEEGDGAARFDGVDDFAEVPDAAALDLGDAFTLEVWVRPGTRAPATLLDKGAGGFALRLDAAGRAILAKPGAGDAAVAASAVPLDGSFHHLVATRSGSGSRVYLDGSDVTGAVTGRTFSDTAAPLRLARADTPTAGESPFAGDLDELALYRGALSAGRVRTHFDVGSSGCVAVAGARASSYTLASADHGATMRALVTASGAGGSATAASGETAVVSTEPPLSTEPPVVWGETVVGGELVAGEGSWAGLEPLAYSFQWQACTDRGYRASVLADAPRGYWRLGELTGPAAHDDSGKGNHGTYAHGTVLGVPGALVGSGDTSRAARFEGLDGHVTVPDRSSLDLGDALTVEEWVRRETIGVQGPTLQKGAGGYEVRVDADDRIHFAKAGAGDIAVSASALPADGRFHHAVATKNGAVSRIYLDGVEVTQAVVNRKLADTGAPLQLGGVPNQGSTAVSAAREVDEVAVYAGALSAARVRAHYEAGASGCADLPGATGPTYTPTAASGGKRLRVAVTARNAAGSAVAVSARSATLVSTAGSGPSLVAGTLTDAAGKPVAGAAVSLYLWPTAADQVADGAPAETPLVAQTVTDAGGNYELAATLGSALEAAAGSGGGILNLELRASAGGLRYESFLERAFEAADPESLALGGDGLAGTGAVWQEGATSLPAGPADGVLAAGEDGVAAVELDPPDHGVDCSNWDIMFGIWKKTGQGESYTRVGELHTWSSMTNRFAYGTRADSDIDVAFKTPTSRWFVNGAVHIGNSSGNATAAGVSATTRPGEYTSRAVKARFVYTHWYQCGTGNKQTRAARWNGYNLAKGVRLSSRDGECSQLVPHIYDPRQDWTRDRNRARYWSVAADLGFFLVGARSGYSRWVTSQWWFGGTLASRTLCGISQEPGKAKRVFAGW